MLMFLLFIMGLWLTILTVLYIDQVRQIHSLRRNMADILATGKAASAKADAGFDAFRRTIAEQDTAINRLGGKFRTLCDAAERESREATSRRAEAGRKSVQFIDGRQN